ncbi:hypothetical protein BJ546DRAFT_177508 [Cryomyces antarcticus]
MHTDPSALAKPLHTSGSNTFVLVLSSGALLTYGHRVQVSPPVSMLRLRPSEIAITPSDIENVFRRLDARHAATNAVNKPRVAVNASEPIPRTFRGAERSRDEIPIQSVGALVHSAGSPTALVAVPGFNRLSLSNARDSSPAFSTDLPSLDGASELSLGGESRRSEQTLRNEPQHLPEQVPNLNPSAAVFIPRVRLHVRSSSSQNAYDGAGLSPARGVQSSSSASETPFEQPSRPVGIPYRPRVTQSTGRVVSHSTPNLGVPHRDFSRGSIRSDVSDRSYSSALSHAPSLRNWRSPLGRIEHEAEAVRQALPSFQPGPRVASFPSPEAWLALAEHTVRESPRLRPTIWSTPAGPLRIPFDGGNEAPQDYLEPVSSGFHYHSSPPGGSRTRLHPVPQQEPEHPSSPPPPDIPRAEPGLGVYNDVLPASFQPQTPADIRPRRRIDTLVNPALTAPAALLDRHNVSPLPLIESPSPLASARYRNSPARLRGGAGSPSPMDRVQLRPLQRRPRRMTWRSQGPPPHPEQENVGGGIGEGEVIRMSEEREALALRAGSGVMHETPPREGRFERFLR